MLIEKLVSVFKTKLLNQGKVLDFAALVLISKSLERFYYYLQWY